MTTPGRAHIRWFRNTAPYINAHRGKTFVLMLGGEAAQHENFANIVHDIALLNSLGVRLVLVHGSRPQIDQRLSRAGLETAFHDNLRITDSEAPAAKRSLKKVRELLADFDAIAPAPFLGSYGEPENREFRQYFIDDSNAPPECPFHRLGATDTETTDKKGKVA